MLFVICLVCLLNVGHVSAVLFHIVDVQTSHNNLTLERIPVKYHHVDDRSKLNSMLDERNYTIGVEIGVQNGYFSAETLRGWKKNTKYYMVDVWRNLATAEKYEDSANVDNDVQEKIYQTAIKSVTEFGDRGILIRNYSTDAAKYFPDLSVDYIYVDARHDYCGVYEDLEAWWPKLKFGGIMAGHDYVTEPEAFKYNGRGHGDWSICGNGSIFPSAVKGAVQKFAHDVAHTKVHSTTDEWATWFYSPKGLLSHGDGHHSSGGGGYRYRRV